MEVRALKWSSAWRIYGSIMGFTFMLSVGIFLWHNYKELGKDYVRASVVEFFSDIGMEIDTVQIIGVQNMPTGPLKAYIGRATDGAILPFLDISGLRLKIEGLNWVDRVSIRRLFPATLLIEITEHVPKARWQKAGKHYLITESGETITNDVSKGFKDLILLVGEGANLRIKELHELLSHGTAIRDRVIASSWIGARRWDIYLTDGLIVKLPQVGAISAWSRLQQLSVDEALLAYEDISVIDMRVEDRLILRFKDGGDAIFPYRDDEGA